LWSPNIGLSNEPTLVEFGEVQLEIHYFTWLIESEKVRTSLEVSNLSQHISC